MILGMSVEAYTILHTIISLVAILAGLALIFALIGNSRPGGLTAIFLVTTILTSAGGFLFPSKMIGPPHILGVLSLIDLAITLYALYLGKLAGIWRPVFVITAVIAVYFNVFVLVVQLFDKVPALHALAPTGTEPPFGAAQGATLVLFVVLGILAVRRYRPLAG